MPPRGLVYRDSRGRRRRAPRGARWRREVWVRKERRRPEPIAPDEERCWRRLQRRLRAVVPILAIDGEREARRALAKLFRGDRPTAGLVDLVLRGLEVETEVVTRRAVSVLRHRGRFLTWRPA